MEGDETQHEWRIRKSRYNYLFQGFLMQDIDGWMKWISKGIWDDGLRTSHGLHQEKMSKKEQRPEAPQANSRMAEARSPAGMLVEVAPAALPPGTGCCCKMPERARGREEGGESRRGWRWGSNASRRQGGGRWLKGALPAQEGCAVSERSKADE